MRVLICISQIDSRRFASLIFIGSAILLGACAPTVQTFTPTANTQSVSLETAVISSPAATLALPTNTTHPTISPTHAATESPTSEPTIEPTDVPTIEPSPKPTETPAPTKVLMEQKRFENEILYNPHTYERQIGQAIQSVTIGLGSDIIGKYSDFYVEKPEWEEKFLDGILYGHYETWAFLRGQEPNAAGFTDYKVRYGDPSQDLSYEVVDTSKGFKGLSLVRVDPRKPTIITLVDTTKNNGIIVFQPNGQSVSTYATIGNDGALFLRPIFMELNLSSGASTGDTATGAVVEAFRQMHIPLEQFTARNDLNQGQWFFDIGRWIIADPTRKNRGFMSNFQILNNNPPRTVLTLK